MSAGRFEIQYLTGFASPSGHWGSFLRWADLDLRQLAADLGAVGPQHRIVTLSQLARRKHRLLRHAVHTAILAVFLMAGSLLAAML